MPPQLIALLAGGVALLAIGTYGGYRWELGAYESIKAAQVAADQIAEKNARDKDGEIARLANDLDSANIRGKDATDKAADALRDAARTRGLYVRTTGKCNLPRTADGAGSGETGTAEARLSDETASALISIARDADQCANYARTCHDWAMTVGK